MTTQTTKSFMEQFWESRPCVLRGFLAGIAFAATIYFIIEAIK
jgi:hypothetical protein